MKVGQPETVAALLERSSRNHVPIRRSFVQQRVRGGGAGPLAAFVHDRRVRALDLYLLGHAVASAPPFRVSFPAAVWARALGLTPHSSSETLVSRTWTWLEDQRLIESQRVGRRREITLLREDGSGEPYRHPGEQGAADRGHYFKLPYAYWEGNFHNRLSLPAKAVLLIALSLQDDFILPTEKGKDWYGLSRDTIRKGLRDLRLHGLLSMHEERKLAPLSALGFTLERRYRLRPPFRAETVNRARRRHSRVKPGAARRRTDARRGTGEGRASA
jgi:hypothetical protein